MPVNFELKAYCLDPVSCEKTAVALGAGFAGEADERDTCFATSGSRLTYRESTAVASRLIAYRRQDAQEARASQYEIGEVRDDDGKVIREALASGLGVGAVVSKHRKTYTTSGWLVSIDRMLDHSFLEIEVFQDGSEESAKATMNWLTGEFGIRKIDIIPRSYADLAPAIGNADRMRSLLGGRLGHVVLIDGPSGAGKSTLVHALRQNLSEEHRFLRRFTSRPERPGDAETDEYTYISVPEFQRMVHEGAFVESKDFLFGMSYGISWSQVEQAFHDSGVRAAFGVMNLGNVRYVKEFAPEIRRVLVTAPLDDLRRRLVQRGTHTQEALDERLDNARMANEAEDLYDVVIWNTDGSFESSLTALEDAVRA